MSSAVVRATYRIETPYPLDRAAAVIAGEQSTGTFVAVPGESDRLKALHAARICSIEAEEPAAAPSLPGAKTPAGDGAVFNRGKVTLEFPLANFGPSIPNLLATVAGNLYELQEVSGLRLLDLELPDDFARRYGGPRFGVPGTRALTGVYGRPIVGTIVKPSIGLSPEELASLVGRLCEAGLDFIKDDELNADPPFATLEQKVKAVMPVIERAADRAGRKVMYAFNITGDIEELNRRHELVVSHGGTCVMASVQSVGFAGLAYLRSFCEVPIHAHRNGWGMLTRHPMLGMSFAAYQKLARLAGADHLHVNALDSKFYESNESVIASVQALRTPLSGTESCMPVLSSGQSAATAGTTYRELGTVDLMNIAGGGILAHPDGAAAGVASMHQAWEAALAGMPAERYAETRPELRRALDAFGRRP
ncbi:ribulose-bisphosphate carboxylase large subunit family protein [Cohnella rhizosphaerae]|uniref:Ribulose-bisphosphate carboxylase large subunit family protein n=1 Tax=Cohnella rhizosphaerae TaxID=1457232 RepID=A0A9X4KXC0_9BACL|nr:ribulose-bisphosphate carboxylase large subunit family protein [Cohnella rhizosphaerae]MDG0812895.1 ribulose-bisphosphate carboxylase large subunit family protein [Cohnella rhizosphaerae]